MGMSTKKERGLQSYEDFIEIPEQVKKSIQVKLPDFGYKMREGAVCQIFGSGVDGDFIKSIRQMPIKNKNISDFNDSTSIRSFQSAENKECL